MTAQAPPELEAEYRALREGAALVDRSPRGKVDVLGRDAAEFLQGLVTNDVEALTEGRGCYAALLSPKGRILADMRLLCTGGAFQIDTEATALDALVDSLDTHKIGREVQIADRSGERAILSLIGPRVADLLELDMPEREHSFVHAKLGGISTLLVATGVGADLILEAGHAAEVRSLMTARGATAVKEATAEIIRIEAGRPRYGHDMTAGNLPAEVGIEERAVSFTKGCYVGQEPVARMHHKGHANRLLRGLRLSRPASGGEHLFADERNVGRVTSACISPALGALALALVRREVEPGHRVGVGDARVDAEVVRLPFGGG